jgi:hypothetical protein
MGQLEKGHWPMGRTLYFSRRQVQYATTGTAH